MKLFGQSLLIGVASVGLLSSTLEVQARPLPATLSVYRDLVHDRNTQPDQSTLKARAERDNYNRHRNASNRSGAPGAAKAATKGGVSGGQLATEKKEDPKQVVDAPTGVKETPKEAASESESTEGVEDIKKVDESTKNGDESTDKNADENTKNVEEGSEEKERTDKGIEGEELASHPTGDEAVPKAGKDDSLAGAGAEKVDSPRYDFE
jgi:phage repressor protein C with HTH and peptisase S24 domain